MKKIVFLFIVLTINAYTLPNAYEPELEKTINSGKEGGLLLCDINLMPYGPTCFAVSANDYVYVVDGWNDRIVIYDFNMDYINEVIPQDKKGYFGPTARLKFDINENIIIVTEGKTLFKFDSKGNTLYSFIESAWKGEYSFYTNFFIFNDKVFYYDLHKNPRIINNDGNILTVEDSMKYLRNNDGWQKGFFNSDPELNKIVVDFLNEHKLVYINERLYVGYYYLHEAFFLLIQNYLKNKNNIHFNIKGISNWVFLGTDEKNNTYWSGQIGQVRAKERYLIIFSKKGELIDVFYNIYGRKIAVSKLGDVFFMDYLDWESGYNDDMSMLFFRIKNVWDPIDDTITETPDTFTSPKALSITLTLNKQITVDEITVAPGYFDPKWWKSNNRVRDMRITYGKISQVLSFKDEMEMQKIKLPEEIWFSKITFEITKVYPSGKDNDTGISEIEFYYKGNKVEIDVSEVK